MNVVVYQLLADRTGWRASLTLGMARLLIRSGLAPLVFAPVARQLGGGVTSVRLEV